MQEEHHTAQPQLGPVGLVQEEVHNVRPQPGIPEDGFENTPYGFTHHCHSTSGLQEHSPKGWKLVRVAVAGRRHRCTAAVLGPNESFWICITVSASIADVQLGHIPAPELLKGLKEFCKTATGEGNVAAHPEPNRERG